MADFFKHACQILQYLVPMRGLFILINILVTPNSGFRGEQKYLILNVIKFLETRVTDCKTEIRPFIRVY